jgi:hypothetical protein
MSKNSEETGVLITNGTKAATSVWNSRVETMNKVNDMLLDAMEKVKENPGFIDQAETMGMVAGRIVDSIKVEVMAAGLLLRANG